jgi:tether containing UBX domain for GLUT4
VQKSKSASVVSIALDVNGQRYVKKLPSDMTLWQVLRQFETAEKGLIITGRGVPVGTNSGQLYYEAPVVNIMGREYSALEDLQKTLSQCGVNSGSMVLRVYFKQSDKTLYDAMQEIGQYLKDVEPDAAPAEGSQKQSGPTTEKSQTEAPPSSEEAPKAEPPTTTVNETPAASAGGETSPGNGDEMDIDSPPVPTSTPATTADPFLPTGVFSAPSSSTPQAAHIQEDDSVYEPTIAHAQLRQQHLQKRAQNTRLKSDEELAAEAAEEAARLASITKVEVKVRFPDQTSAVWTLTPEHTGNFLYQAIRGVMSHPEAHFKLILPGPHIVIHEDDKKLIAGYKLKGREMFHLLWEDSVPVSVRKVPFLKGSVASTAREIVVPEVPRESPDDDEEAGPSVKPVKQEKPQSSGSSSMDSEAVRKKLSRFLGLKK